MRTLLLSAALFAASFAVAQTPPPPPHERVKVLTRTIEGPGMVVAGAPADNLQFVAAEFSFDGMVVKGSPYSAEALTETTQVLADGNKINRKNTAQLYRDSEGRTRRDQTIGHIGPWASGSGLRSSIIHDPVADVRYILEPETKIARKLPALALSSSRGVRVPAPEGAPAAGTVSAFPTAEASLNIAIAGPARIGPPGEHIKIQRIRPGGMGAEGTPDFKTESLGTKVVEGVVAEGTKTILTIPAGQIGNERPIEVASERWYSPELQTVVMTRTSDPRMGETTYRLTNIHRGEPGKHLFEVPSDYIVKESNVRAPQIEILKSTEREPI